MCRDQQTSQESHTLKMENSFTPLAKHLPGKSNEIADSLSRFNLQEFRRLAPEAETTPQQCPPHHQILL